MAVVILIGISLSSIIKADRAPFLRGREGAGEGTHILRGRPSLEYRALIGQTAYVHPMTYTP